MRLVSRLLAAATRGPTGLPTVLFTPSTAAQSSFSSLLPPSLASSMPSMTRRGFAEVAVAKEKAKPLSAKERQAQQITLVDAPLKRYKPFTPSMRHTVIVDKRNLWKGRPVKQLTTRLKTHAGRNNQGRITVRHRGGGHKRLYRFIDFKRSILDEPAVVQRFEYDPYRTAFIALVAYPDNRVSYMLAPQGLKVGDVITSSKDKELEILPGNCMPIGNMPIGTVFHNLEIRPGKGGQIAKAAGTSCSLLDKRGKPGFGLVAIASKEQRYVRLNCMATVGEVSNPMHHLVKLGKAGRKRWMGRRPHVRGVAMNPVDHPMGGGEGRSSGGRQPCSPTGVLAKGYKTNRKKNASNPLIVVKRGGLKK